MVSREGRDVMGLAQTGTGKAALALPILSDIDMHQKSPQALVLAPTRELALQVSEAFAKYAAGLPGMSTCCPSTAARAYGVQLSALRRGVHVVVGTPGRIMDHLEKRTLDLSELSFLVLDEADEMLKMDFAEDVETILSGRPDTKQVALFSATMPAAIRWITAKHLTDPVEVAVKNKTQTVSTVTQRYLIVAYPRRSTPSRASSRWRTRRHDRVRPHQERDRGGGREAARQGRPARPRPPRGQRRHLATYRISVRRRHKVEPRQIVGALANEGGLGRADFGRIDIRMDHSLVDLPVELPAGAWDRLRSTRISGKLIELSKDTGAPPRREGDDRPKKPRHKKD